MKIVKLKPKEVREALKINAEKEQEVEDQQLVEACESEVSPEEDGTKGMDFTTVDDEVEAMIANSAGEELQARAVDLPLTAVQPPAISPTNETPEAHRELEKDHHEEGEIVKTWAQKDVNEKHSLLGEIAQYNVVLSHLSEIGVDDMEEEHGGGDEDEGNIENDNGKNPIATDEVDTTKVVKTPEEAKGMEESHQEGDKKVEENNQRKEDKESTDNKEADDMQDVPIDEENVPVDEEAAKQRTALILYNNVSPTSRAGVAPLEATDEVNMTTVVITESADKDKNEQHAPASQEEEPTLDEAADINTTEVKKTKDETKDEPTAATGEVEKGTEANEGTADQAGPSDGGRPL